MGKIVRWNGLVWMALVVSVTAAVRERRGLARAMEEISHIEDSDLKLDLFRRAFVSHLSGTELDPPLLSGHALGPSHPGGIRTVEAGPGLLYYLSEDCPISSTNLQFLNELVDRGFPVFGLVFGSDQGAIEQYVSRWRIRFPVFLSPEGSAARVVPRYATPTTVVVSTGEVVFLGFGELGPEEREQVRSVIQG